jgi:Cu(I)/Ag(I) efflux system membrane protein CusA/SilA
MLKRIIAGSIDHPALTLFFIGAIIAGGVWAIQTTPIDAIPDLSDVQVIVYSQWDGQDPQTIEDQVTYPISQKMLAVPGVTDVRGFSYFGFSLVYVIFEDGTDIYWARSRVLEYQSELGGRLPPGARTSLGPDASGVGWVYQYTVEDPTGVHGLARLRSLQDWYIRYQLMSVPGVAEVATIGGQVDQYQVEVDPNRLLAYGLPLDKVIRAVRAGNSQVGGRLIELAEREYMVRGLGYVGDLEDLRRIVVATDAAGTPILLQDVATVGRGPDIRRGLAERDGEGEVTGGIVVMRFGENALAVIDAVKEKIREISAGLPEGVEVRPVYDRSGLIHRATATLWRQLLEEIGVMALVLMAFLWHARSALTAVLSLPLGILLSFIVMRVLDINANIMSLGGIAIAIGAMDDAAVTLVENAHKHLEEWKGDRPRREVIKDAAVEVGPALFFSLLVVTVSFLPVFILPGQSGRLFGPLVYTKTFAMAAAALLAITAMPLLLWMFVRGRIVSEQANPISRYGIAIYRPVIRWVLRWRWAVVLGAAGVVALTWFPYGKIGSEFMPPLREGDILYMPTTVPGISITEARRVLQTQDKLFRTFPEVQTAFGKIGRAETATDPAPLSMVETTVTLLPEEAWPARKVRDGYVAGLAREAIQRLRARGALVAAEGEHADAHTDASMARDAEGMTLRELHPRIRVAIVQGAQRAELERLVRERLAAQLTDDLRATLRSHDMLARGQVGAVREEVRAVLGEQDEPVPLRQTTYDELMQKDMEQAFQFPGMANAWTMPIKTRIDMLATGIKTPIGIKVKGQRLADIQAVALRIEELLTDPLTRPEGTLSAIAERALGGTYVDVDIDRDACARYALTIERVQSVVKTAVGGMNISWTVEGRERFPINIRYPRAYREDPEALRRVLVATSTGAQIPLGQLASIRLVAGPPGIKTENGLLQSIVYVDIQDVDVGSYVTGARAMVERELAADLKAHPGTFIEWSGQYEYMEEANEKLRVVVPLTLAVVFFLLYLNFRRLSDVLIVMVTVLFFAPVGGVWLMYVYDFNWSVAVVVGFIALLGLAAETGVLMIEFLNMAYDKVRGRGAITRAALHGAILDGAVRRVRPLLMSVTTTILGLLPIMWATGAGARPMWRMATPMIGGLISALVLTLVVIPAFYAIAKEFSLRLGLTDETWQRDG